MNHDATTARALLATLLANPAEANPRLNEQLSDADRAETIVAAMDALADAATGQGTYFTAQDLPEDVLDKMGTQEAAQEWLDRNAKHIIEAMRRAGNDAIETSLLMDGYYKDEDA